MLKIAHRGASAYAPENTLTSFMRGIEMGADGIELDVHRCKSGELVVIHDDTVDRTANGKGIVAELTLGELQALTIADSEHIPTLAEVFETLGKEIYYFVEIKHADAALLAAELMQAYQMRGWPAEQLILISFKHAALRHAKEIFPALTIGASFEKLTDASIAQAKTLGASAILPHHQSYTEKYVQHAHIAGLKIIPWTVNDAKDIARLQGLNVDGIISDYPDRLASYG